MPQLSAKKRYAFSPRVVVRGLSSLIGCSFLIAYWLFLGINISFIYVGLRLCCDLNISIIRSCIFQT